MTKSQSKKSGLVKALEEFAGVPFEELAKEVADELAEEIAGRHEGSEAERLNATIDNLKQKLAEAESEKEDLRTGRALIASPEIVNYLESQYSLPYDELLSIVAYDAKYPPSERGMKQLVTMAKMYQLPVTALAYIPTKTGGQPYVKAEGVNWRLQLDLRGLKAMYAEPVQWPTKENGWRVIFKGIVEFANGQVFTAYASLSKETEPYTTVDNLIMKCSTKAIRRAGIIAVAIPFPVFEEFADWEESERRRSPTGRVTDMRTGEVIDSTTTEVEPGPSYTIGNLAADALAKGIGFEDLCKKLGVSNIGEITSPLEAAYKLGIKEREPEEKEEKTNGD